MKHLSLIFTMFAMLIGMASCAEKNEPTKNNDLSSNDEYYVRYSIKADGVYEVFRDIYYADVSGMGEKLNYQLRSWDVTIGPVKKGFHATVCNKHGSATNKIEVAKNSGPFALKASGKNSASYKIDF